MFPLAGPSVNSLISGESFALTGDICQISTARPRNIASLYYPLMRLARKLCSGIKTPSAGEHYSETGSEGRPTSKFVRPINWDIGLYHTYDLERRSMFRLFLKRIL